MTVKVVTDFRELLRLARAMGDAEKSGTAEEFEKAKKEHDAYRDLCLGADEMATGLTFGQL